MTEEELKLKQSMEKIEAIHQRALDALNALKAEQSRVINEFVEDLRKQKLAELEGIFRDEKSNQ